MLVAALIKNEVPHAMLFTGEAGIGKKTTAMNFAMAVHCKTPGPMAGGVSFSGTRNVDPCGACRPCRNIASGNHPDVHYVAPSGAYIRIDSIRSLCETISLRPAEGDVRIALIAEAHLMNAEAGNALLKVLEEPPGKTVFILSAPQAADILPTIVSRCRQIRFNPIPEDRLTEYLVDNAGLLQQDACAIARLAGGSIGTALALSGNRGIIAHRKQVIDRMEMIFSGPSGSDLQWAETLAADREKALLSLEIMKSWLRDLAVFPVSPDRIVNSDDGSRISEKAGRLEDNQLLEKLDAIWQTERALQSNAKLRLAMEALFMKLAK